MEKTKVLYIAGVGHCGSTILNLLLGSAKNTFSLGETKPLPIFLQEEKTPHRTHQFNCTCGEKVINCPIWRDLDISKDNLLSDQVSPDFRLSIVWGAIKKDLPEVNASNSLIYPQLLSRAKREKGKHVEWLIDSSKDMELLAHLMKAESIDLHVIHMVRSAPANVNSLERRGRNWLSALFFWMYRNLTIYFLKNLLSKDKIMTVQYESFTKHTDKLIRRLDNKWGIRIPEDYIQAINTEEYHNFAGNGIRNKDIKSIQMDVSWKNEMSIYKQILIRSIAKLPAFLWR